MRSLFIPVLGMLLLALGAPMAGACPEQLPPKMTAAAVGDDLAVNGMPVSILYVQGPEPVATVFAQLEKVWREAGYDVRRNTLPGWSVLSALSDKCMTTLQLQGQSGSAGYLAVQRRAPSALAARPSVPMPPGATVLSVVDSNDQGRKATITALKTWQPLTAVREFFVHRLREERWGAVRADVAMSDRNLGPQAVVVSAQRGNQRIEVVLWRDGDTWIVINAGATL